MSDVYVYSVAIYFQKYLTLYNSNVSYEGRMSSSDGEQDNKFLFCKESNCYKYAYLNINEDEFYLHGISKNVDIEKTKAINLLTWKFYFEKLELRTIPC